MAKHAEDDALDARTRAGLQEIDALREESRQKKALEARKMSETQTEELWA